MSWNPLPLCFDCRYGWVDPLHPRQRADSPPPVPTPTLSQAQQVAVAATNDANATNIALTLPTHRHQLLRKTWNERNAYPVGQSC